MDEIYPVYREADVVIFASPMYFWTISGQLKCAWTGFSPQRRAIPITGFPVRSALC